jgi:hypothetical protein
MKITLGDDPFQNIHLPPDLPFFPPHGVDTAGLELVDAVVERVLHLVHVEVRRAPLIGPIQKRTMVFMLSHAATLAPLASVTIIGAGGVKT